jgi:hypothetical protein
MTTPVLAVSVKGRGRHYPYMPQDTSGWTLNRWGSVNPEDVPDGVAMYPSVTNILSVYSDGGDGLLYWAGEQAVRAMYRDGFPADVDRAVELHRGAFRKARQDRADAGTRAHTLAEVLASDLPLPTHISVEDEQYADAFMRFWTDVEPEPLYTEGTVYSYDWAGTADLIAMVDGMVTVIDYKTRGKPEPKPRVYDKTRLQLAGLAAGHSVAVQDERGWRLDPMQPADHGMAVILYPDGTYHAETVDDLGRWEAGFEGAWALWRAVKGTPAPAEGGAAGAGARAEGSSADSNDRGSA